MAALHFENQEAEYLQWLASHPNGYVVSTYRKFRPDHIRIHTARCHLIRQYMRHMGPNAFTGHLFKKVCSDSVAELRRWAKHHGYPVVPRCGSCNPK